MRLLRSTARRGYGAPATCRCLGPRVRISGPSDAVADEIAQWPEADYVVVTAGQFDLLVEVVARDRRELLDLTNRMRAVEGVVSTETFFYLEMWKQIYDWAERTRRGGR